MEHPVFPGTFLNILRSARRVAVLTGAGVSAESGIPTFREAQTGLWAQYDPAELATPMAFRRNPARVWAFYAARRERIGQAAPNPGHYALAALEAHVPHFCLVTQNIDSLHHKAGSRNVVELHGNISRTRCNRCYRVVASWEEPEVPPPTCPHCRGLLRPDVVWFHENLPREALSAGFRAAEEAEVFFSIGTSAQVYPAASLPLIAKEHGAVTVEVNPVATPLTPRMDYTFPHPSGHLLPRLITALGWDQD